MITLVEDHVSRYNPALRTPAEKSWLSAERQPDQNAAAKPRSGIVLILVLTQAIPS